jgi:S-sulfo-L-cysteine synthase (O-acetyl-L-serine-dependent)
MSRNRRIESIVDAVGNTPIVRLRNIGGETPDVKLYLKLEYCNPGGSVKDRPALQMMRDAIADGRLTKGKVLIDATSGNTGVAYSLFGAALGHRIRLVMPSNVSQARKDITQAYGTELVFSDPMEGSDGAIRMCRQLVAESPNEYFYADQYRNPSNPRAHYLGTGREILEQVGDEITHFVTGLGTSGTSMGTTRRLHEHSRKIVCIAAQPAEALHGLEGLKHMDSSIVPEIYDPNLPDEHMAVNTEDGWDMADRLASDEGLHVGHSTGANVFAALQIAKRIGKGCVVTVACDRGDRYFAPMRWEKHYEW